MHIFYKKMGKYGRNIQKLLDITTLIKYNFLMRYESITKK